MIASQRTSLNQSLTLTSDSQSLLFRHARRLTDMRVLIIFAIISVVWVVVCSAPIDDWIDGPGDHDVYIRSPQVKGGKPVTKEYNPPMPALRKGEYICGNKVCKLKPGQIPPNCHGVCQYPVL